MAVRFSDSTPDTANAQHPKGNSLIRKELLMIAQGRTLKLLRLTGIVGIITGIAMSIADISLLYSSAGGYESDAMLLTVPMWRLLLGHYLGVLMLPFYLIAIWHLYEGIKPGGAWRSIPVVALLGYVAAAGGAFHGSIAGLALIAQAGVGAPPEAQTVLTDLLANAHKFIEPLQAVVFLAGFVGSIWLGAAILSGHTAYPRWFLLANPVLVHAVLFASYFLTPNPVSTLLLPATASLSLLILFGFSTALLWNGGPEPQRGGQTAFAPAAGG
jgi:hypothetical protein